MKQVVAKYPGTCPICESPIQRGDVILWDKGEGAIHIACGSSNTAGPGPVSDEVWKKFTTGQRERYKAEHGEYPPAY